MTEIEPIIGPVASPENIRRHERTTADVDKFKEQMKLKMTQVDESDAEQQKKRKQQAEQEEEKETLPEPEVTPASQVTPFDLHKQVSPIDVQEGGKISPISSAQPTLAPPPPSPSPFMQTSSAGTEDSMWDEESASVFNVPTQAEAQPQPTYPQATPAPEQSLSAQGPAQTQPQQQAMTPQPSEQSQQQGQRQDQQQQPVQSERPTEDTSKSSPSEPQPPTDSKKPPAKEEVLPSTQPKEEAVGAPGKGIPGEALSGAEMGSKEAAAAVLQQMGKGKEKLSLTQQQAEALAAQAAKGPAPAIPALTASEGGSEGDLGKKKKEAQSEVSSGNLGMPPPQLVISGETPLAPTPPPAYTAMSSQVLDLYERMVGVMTIMTDSKMTETVITLNAPKFASSVFYGTQIIIQEYASAPKAFNIQLNGNPQAVALFQGNADDLMAAFQYGNYNFRVNRMDTGYLSDRPVFHRKEDGSGGKQDQPDKGQQ